MVLFKTPFHQNIPSHLYWNDAFSYTQIGLPYVSPLHILKRLSPTADLEAFHGCVFHGEVWLLVPLQYLLRIHCRKQGGDSSVFAIAICWFFVVDCHALPRLFANLQHNRPLFLYRAVPNGPHLRLVQKAATRVDKSFIWDGGQK